jgi:hypothetical protein
MSTLDDQLRLFDDDDDALGWHSWFMSLPPTPPSQPQLFPEPARTRRAA